MIMPRRNTNPCEIEDITREAFAAYEEVRASGEFNMMMNAAQAAEAADLEDVVYWGILNHYTKLAQKWPDVRSKHDGAP